MSIGEITMSYQPVCFSSRLPAPIIKERIPFKQRFSQIFLRQKDIVMDPKASSTPTKTASEGAVAKDPAPKPYYGDNTCTYKWLDSDGFKGAESLSLVAGKSLGSGTYAKVKAVYCPAKNELVSVITSSRIYKMCQVDVSCKLVIINK